MIAILTATYNGERYLAQQLDSLLGQSVQDFVVYLCDDCSTDRTYEIATEYAQKYPDKFICTRNARNSGSAKHNFIRMMIQHKAEYVMLCDQDDVWLPDKIERTLGKMRELEQKEGAHTPLLVHTDLVVVDEQLKIISPSFIKALNANYRRTQLHQIVIQNTLTGCTAMYNRALAELVFAEPAYMVMHDWWLILIASAFGKVAHLEEGTVLYRQHEGNSIGAKDVRTLRYKLDRFVHNREVRQALAQTYEQAESFLALFCELLSQEQRRFLRDYCAIPAQSKGRRLLSVLRLRTFKYGFSRRVAQLLFL